MTPSHIPMINDQAAETPLPTALSWLEEGRRKGQHHGAQVYVSLAGRTVANTGLGLTTEDVAVERTTIVPWRCSGKPFLAVAMARLKERSLLSWEDPVTRYLPAFAAHGKGDIRLTHLLSHTAPISTMGDPVLRRPDLSAADALDSICALKPIRGVRPGKRGSYGFWWSWIVLGAIVEQITGQAMADHVADAVFRPLGMPDCSIGLGDRSVDDVAPIYDCAEVDPARPMTRLSDFGDDTLRSGRPSDAAIGPMSQLARLYEVMQSDTALRATGVLDPATARDLRSRCRVGLKEPGGGRIDWGLGFELESRWYGPNSTSFGPDCSKDTYGHKGHSVAIGFADPRVDLVVAAFVNGQIEGRQHGRRIWTFVHRVYDDLGLASSDSGTLPPLPA